MKLPGFLAQPLAVPSQTRSVWPADLSHVFTLLRAEEFSGSPSGLMKRRVRFCLGSFWPESTSWSASLTTPLPRGHRDVCVREGEGPRRGRGRVPPWATGNKYESPLLLGPTPPYPPGLQSPFFPHSSQWKFLLKDLHQEFTLLLSALDTWKVSIYLLRTEKAWISPSCCRMNW